MSFNIIEHLLQQMLINKFNNYNHEYFIFITTGLPIEDACSGNTYTELLIR